MAVYRVTVVRPDRATLNGSVYTKDGCDSFIAEYENRSVPVGTEFDEDMLRVPPHDICGHVEKIRYDGEDVVGDFVPAEGTPFYESAIKLIEEDEHPEFCLIPCFIGKEIEARKYDISSLLGFIIDKSENNAFLV